MSNTLGTSKEILQLETIDENRQVTLELAQQARRELIILTQDLDSSLYDNELFERALFELAGLHPSTRIRILAQDVTHALHNGHALLRLAQTLTSSVFIRKPSHEHRKEQGAFIVADNTGYSHRVVGNQYNYKASACFADPLQANQLNNYFNEMWEHSEEDPQLRRLYV